MSFNGANKKKYFKLFWTKLKKKQKKNFRMNIKIFIRTIFEEHPPFNKLFIHFLDVKKNNNLGVKYH